MRKVIASDSSLLVIFGDFPRREYHDQVLRLFRALSLLKDDRIRNLHPAYASLLIDFDPLRLDHDRLGAVVSEALQPEPEYSAMARTVEIPVCYEAEMAPDIGFVSSHCGLGVPELISRHSGPLYDVAFLGFSPGFAYLLGLPSDLVTPRHITPRRHVPAGSVGIAGNQTGVYPQDSPGGWQLIGRTPLRMFDAGREPASLVLPGDKVRFLPITSLEFAKLAAKDSGE